MSEDTKALLGGVDESMLTPEELEAIKLDLDEDAPSADESETGEEKDNDEQTTDSEDDGDVADEDDSEDDSDEADDDGDEADDDGDEAEDDSDEAEDEADVGDTEGSTEEAASLVADIEELGQPQQYVVPEELEPLDINLSAERLKLAEQVDDGELTMVEYNTKLDELTKQVQEHGEAVEAREAAIRANDNALIQHWEDQKSAFFSANPMFDPNTSSVMHDALMATIDRMSNNNEFAADITNEKALAQAANRVLEGLPNAAKSVEVAEAPKKEAKRPKPKKKAEAPTTLRDAPKAADNDTGKSKFADIDSLEGEAYESALAKMTPSERQAYMEAV